MKITTFSEPKELVKEGLLFYSSTEKEPLVDSKGTAHTVTPEDIKALAHNTNEYLKLTDIYVFKEHDRDPETALGLISDSGCFEAKEITEDIASQHPKLKPLIGRWGLFCNNVKLVNENIIDKVSKGLSRSVSIGADLVNKVVKELSITATPAAAGSSLFSTDISKLVNFNMDTTAVTLEEALQTADDDEQLKAEVMELVCTFMTVVENIVAMSDEDLGNYQVASKEELYQAQLESFMMMLDEKINPFNQETLDQEQGQIDPRMQPQQAQYNYPLAITTFDEMDQYISEYGLGSMLKVAGSGIKAGLKGGLAGAKANRAGVTGIGNKIKKSATGFLKGSGIATKAANVANKGLGKLSAGMAKSASATGNVDRMNASKVINEARKKLVNKRRASGFNSSSKLSKFMK